MVGDNLAVTVVAIEGGRVRLGFEAPEDVMIRREELVFEMPVLKPVPGRRNAPAPFRRLSGVSAE
jgi:hypothetical protein